MCRISNSFPDAMLLTSLQSLGFDQRRDGYLTVREGATVVRAKTEARRAATVPYMHAACRAFFYPAAVGVAAAGPAQGLSQRDSLLSQQLGLPRRQNPIASPSSERPGVPAPRAHTTVTLPPANFLARKSFVRCRPIRSQSHRKSEVCAGRMTRRG